MQVMHVCDNYIKHHNLLPGLISYMRSCLNNHGVLNKMIIPHRTFLETQQPYSAYVNSIAAAPSLDIFVTKITAFLAGESGKENTINSLVTVFSMSQGVPLNIFSGQGITNLKTAAISGLVTDYCAKDCAQSLAIIGSGVQARQQFYAVTAVRNINKVKVFSRNPNNVYKFIQELKAYSSKDINFIAAGSTEEAIQNVDIICTATTSIDPLITKLDKKDNLHINVIGPYTTISREVDVKLLSTAQLVVEDVQTAINEAGSVHETAIPVQELSMVLKGLKDKFTIFSSTGYAMLDLITTSYLIKNMEEMNDSV